MDQLVREAYESTWGRRRDPPIVMESWVENDWAKGRTDYLTFLIRVGDESVARATRVVQDAFSGFNCLDPFPQEYLHVTVKETGCFLTDALPEEDELTKGKVEDLIEGASEALSGVNCFEIKFENINHFRSNIVVEAHDSGEIREMNRRLMDLDGVKKLGYDYPRFLPHMSICQFNCGEDHDKLVDLMEGMRDSEAGSLYVESIELVKAVLPVTGRNPILETIEIFKLV